MSEGAKLYLIDASPYVFRAHFALPATIRTPEGRPAAATYGFVSTLLKLLEDERPTHAAVAFDRSLTTSFRNEILPSYKTGRTLPPPELEAQLGDCEELAAALGFACFVSDRYEADDLIATLVRNVAGERCDVTVVSSDKDLAQLVDERVSLFDLARGRREGPAEVRARLGVRPDQVVDYLALAGDPVDAIPGVRGVGPRTAASLLERFGTLEGVLAHLDEIAPALRRRLEDGRASALLSRRLAVAALDESVAASLEDLRYRGADRALAERAFGRLGFGTLRQRIRGWRD